MLSAATCTAKGSVFRLDLNIVRVKACPTFSNCSRFQEHNTEMQHHQPEMVTLSLNWFIWLSHIKDVLWRQTTKALIHKQCCFKVYSLCIRKSVQRPECWTNMVVFPGSNKNSCSSILSFLQPYQSSFRELSESLLLETKPWINLSMSGLNTIPFIRAMIFR